MRDGLGDKHWKKIAYINGKGKGNRCVCVCEDNTFGVCTVKYIDHKDNTACDGDNLTQFETETGRGEKNKKTKNNTK